LFLRNEQEIGLNEQEIVMAYTCQNCGVEAEKESSLCNPISEKLESKFCDTSSKEVCKDKNDVVRFACDACGRLSANYTYLCHPTQFK
jgi:predicted RNA-binding Zn-ribbon protein involved in translation (DUF1610 family)